MPSCCTLYKGLVTLVLLLIVVQYFFGIGLTENGQFFTFTFTVNNSSKDTTKDRNIEQIRSPLIRTLISAKKNKNETADARLASNFSTAINFIYNSTSSPLYRVATTEAAALGNSSELPLCPENPLGLGTSVKVIKSDPPSILELERRFSWLKQGGRSYPETCRTLKKVALIVPFRCRAEHLLLFLQHMHPFLHRQELDYTLFIIEQEGDGAFNRALLMNVGFVEALKIMDFDCFVFHDIDLLPEDERNLYTCPEQPRHMSVAIDSFNYKLPYTSIFGGVSAMTREHFQLLNGFSNSFWGWGGEDDDMSNRLRFHNLYISRYPMSIARYTMLTHKKEKANPTRYDTLKAGKLKYETDGLSNLRYTLKQKKRNLLYTWLLVEIGPHS